jgi:hypothetical protein
MTSDHVARLDPQSEQQLVTELAAAVLEQIDPDELAVFDETAQEYFADPEGVLDPRRRDEPVGFGVDMALLAPYLLAVATPVVQFLVTVVWGAVQEEAKPAVVRRVRRLFRRNTGPAPADAGTPQPAPLSPEQARYVRDVAYQRARALGLPEDRSTVLADAIVGGVLVTT